MTSPPPAQLRFLTPEEIPAFVQEVLFAADRTRPVLAFTTPNFSPGSLPLEPRALVERFGSRAILVALETGEATWALSGALPPRFQVYGGAARIWWPGLDRKQQPEMHPLLLRQDHRSGLDLPARVELVLERGQQRPQEVVARPAKEILTATVTDIQEQRIYVAVLPTRPDVDMPLIGLLAYTGLPLNLLVQWLRIGQHLPVWRISDDPRTGLPRFSCKKVLSTPWERFKSLVAIGEVVTGVVKLLEGERWRVEVLPGVQGSVEPTEVAWEPAGDPLQELQPDQEVGVRILRCELDTHRLELSIKRAQGYAPRERLTLIPDGWPFPRRAEDLPGGGVPLPSPELGFLREEVGELRSRLEAVEEDHQRLTGALRDEKQRSGELRKQLKSEQDRNDLLERRSLDPLADERSFLTAVRVAYARLFGEEDRTRYPLGRMKVNGAFMASLQKLEGLGPDKVVEVCAQVASGRAHRIPGREVHPLRAGPGGSPQRVRASDQATAWRCSLQDGTASARRLHWWQASVGGEVLVEFAQVGVHDDEGIPE